MKYALVKGERQEAQPGLPGQCPCCERPVIAKCGIFRSPHWSHKGKLECNSSKEPETEWHRAWKNHFPEKCQEVVQYADNGEKYIADVKVDQGDVIEFQHSPIKPEERLSREEFYKKMIWIVDGTRRPKDKAKFIDVWKLSVPVKGKVEVWKLRGGFEKCPLLRDWADSTVPVFFDLGEDFLLGILPKDFSEERHIFGIERYLVGIERKALIAALHPLQQGINFTFLLMGWVFSIRDSQPKKEMVPSSQSQQPQTPNPYVPRHLRLRRF